MAGWQPQQYDPRAHQQRIQQPPQQQVEPWQQQEQQWGNPPAMPPVPLAREPAVRIEPGTGLTAAGKFWYILGCISFGAAYFAKVPAKRALADFGMAEMTAAEQFWYVLMCISFGAGYFAKLPVAKALSETRQSG